MAERQINAKFILRNDTASNWTSANPTLLKAELGIETDTLKIKIGDGSTAWNSLKYFEAGDIVVKDLAPSGTDSDYNLGTLWVNTTDDRAYILTDNTPSSAVWKKIVYEEDLSGFGNGDMLKSEFATNEKSGEGYVDKAILADTATKLSEGKTISLTGDATGTSEAFDGSQNVSVNVVLADSGVSAGTHTKVTVDSKGRVTKGENLAVEDIPDLTLSKITDAGTAASKDVGTSEGNVPVIGAGNKLDASILPAIAITDTFEADSEEAMIGLSAQQGDVCVRSDVNKSFILKNNEPSVAENWVELKTPTDAVLSVNGETGAVVLNTDKISEGTTNQYFTEERATQNFNTNIAKTAVASLSDGSKVLMEDNTFIFDGGNA